MRGYRLLLQVSLALGIVAMPTVLFACGVERWAVKTFADSDAARVNLTPVAATVASLNGIPAPSRAELDAKPNGRFPAELSTYRVEGYLIGFKREADEDFHIVIKDLSGPSTMVVEIPWGSCVPKALQNDSVILQAAWETRFGKVTSKFKDVHQHKIKVEIIGVGFFDFIHGQTGVAKNGFELHRVISWKELR